jgi:hypothetical protein
VQWLAFQRSTAAAICFFQVLPTFDLTAKKPPDKFRFRSRSHNAVIRVYDEAGNVIETHDHTGDFKEW